MRAQGRDADSSRQVRLIAPRAVHVHAARARAFTHSARQIALMTFIKVSPAYEPADAGRGAVEQRTWTFVHAVLQDQPQSAAALQPVALSQSRPERLGVLPARGKQLRGCGADGGGGSHCGLIGFRWPVWKTLPTWPGVVLQEGIALYTDLTLLAPLAYQIVMSRLITAIVTTRKRPLARHEPIDRHSATNLWKPDASPWNPAASARRSDDRRSRRSTATHRQPVCSPYARMRSVRALCTGAVVAEKPMIAGMATGGSILQFSPAPDHCSSIA
jgi:hypothetical protein